MCARLSPSAPRLRQFNHKPHDTMRTNTYSHLEALAASKRIVCERTGKRITLTTPDGGTTAECDSVAEALDTLSSDPTFADLPIVLRSQSTPEETAKQAKQIKADLAEITLAPRAKPAPDNLSRFVSFLKSTERAPELYEYRLSNHTGETLQECTGECLDEAAAHFGMEIDRSFPTGGNAAVLRARGMSFLVTWRKAGETDKFRKAINDLRAVTMGLLEAYAPNADKTAATHGESILHSSVKNARQALRETAAI
jgi:hypothetical protein